MFGILFIKFLNEFLGCLHHSDILRLLYFNNYYSCDKLLIMGFIATSPFLFYNIDILES